MQSVLIECIVCQKKSETEKKSDRHELSLCLNCFVEMLRTGKLEDIRWKYDLMNKR